MNSLIIAAVSTVIVPLVSLPAACFTGSLGGYNRLA